MLDSQIETLWQESLNTSRIPVQGGMSQTYDPIKVFAKKIAKYLIDEIKDPIAKDQIRKACGLFERSSVVVSTVTGESFEVKGAVILTHEHLTEEEWRNYQSADPIERRLIAKEKGTPLENVIRLENLLR